MKYLEDLTWINCEAIDCEAGRVIDSRHVDNLNASGGWHCPGHQSEVPC